MSFKNENHNPFEGFSKLTRENRIAKISQLSDLSQKDLKDLQGQDENALSLDQAEHLIENVVGTFALPLGIATHFFIDGRDVPIPMVVEETSIVAAASAAAKWVRRNGGFKTEALGSLIIGQIQIPKVIDLNNLKQKISFHKTALIDEANEVIPNLITRGGGVKDIQLRILDRPDGAHMGVIHILCDPCNAMGANLINQVCEALKPVIEKLTHERVGLCILSNLVDTKLYEARCEISDIDPNLAMAIAEANLFAELDPYRRATHIKGIMNGIDPVLIATGNDWRAVETAVHTYASLPDSPKAITSWQYENGVLKGRIRLPLAVGTVGGITKIHPGAKAALKLMNIHSSDELARICAATGLAQNLSALKALCSEGIIRGHMRLHASNFALMTGATKEEMPLLEEMLKQESKISLSKAQELLEKIRATL